MKTIENYHLLYKIASGNYGKVYKAENFKSLSCDLFAIKVVPS